MPLPFAIRWQSATIASSCTAPRSGCASIEKKYAETTAERCSSALSFSDCRLRVSFTASIKRLRGDISGKDKAGSAADSASDLMRERSDAMLRRALGARQQIGRNPRPRKLLSPLLSPREVNGGTTRWPSSSA